MENSLQKIKDETSMAFSLIIQDAIERAVIDIRVKFNYLSDDLVDEMVSEILFEWRYTRTELKCPDVTESWSR